MAELDCTINGWRESESSQNSITVIPLFTGSSEDRQFGLQVSSSSCVCNSLFIGEEIQNVDGSKSSSKTQGGNMSLFSMSTSFLFLFFKTAQAV